MLAEHGTARPHHAALGRSTIGLLPLPCQPAAHRPPVAQALDAQWTAGNVRLFEQEIGERAASQPKQCSPWTGERGAWRHTARPDQGLSVDAQHHFPHPQASAREWPQSRDLIAVYSCRPLPQGLYLEALTQRHEPPAQRARRAQPLAQHRSARGIRFELQVRPNSSPSSRARCCAALIAFTKDALTLSDSSEANAA